MNRNRIDIFVVDDDRLFREEVLYLLREGGYAVEAFENLATCRHALRERSPHVILLDIQLPDGNGVELLKEVVATEHHPEVVIVSGAASLQEAADSMKHGAADFLEKPFEPERLLSILDNCTRIARLKQINRKLIESRLAEYRIVGESKPIQYLREQIRQIASTDARILITGESGTGKELVAGQIHFLSRRSSAPFVKVNCSALPLELVESELFGHIKGAFTGAIKSRNGRFVQADGGTLLLDEIGDMPQAIQPKLLRALETNEVEPMGASKAIEIDIRLISSTNHDIEKLAEENKFRADLLFRINTIPVHLPPLRDYREDIPLLVNHFLEMLISKEPFSQIDIDNRAIEPLVSYDWPGNVRQLKNVVERLFYTTRKDSISPDDVQACLGEKDTVVDLHDAAFAGANRFSTAVLQFERGYLKAELEKTEGNITQLAERLGMDRGNLYRKLKRLDLLSN